MTSLSHFVLDLIYLYDDTSQYQPKNSPLFL